MLELVSGRGGSFKNLLVGDIANILSSAAKNKATDSPFIQPMHGILNDSSFAAVTTSDGSRHVFFQDINTNLRQAIYSSTIRGWITTMNLVPNTTDARLHTPISAIAQADSQGDLSEIVLVYIDSSRRLAGTTFSSGAWTNTTAYLNISQYVTAPASRAISLNVVPNTVNSSELLLFFEDSGGNITGLYGTHIAILPFFTPTVLWSWEDITKTIQSSLAVTHSTLSSPFSASYAWIRDNSTAVSMGISAVFFDPLADSMSTIVGSEYSNHKFNTCRPCLIDLILSN